jgi:hypothetical protein
MGGPCLRSYAICRFSSLMLQSGSWTLGDKRKRRLCSAVLKCSVKCVCFDVLVWVTKLTPWRQNMKVHHRIHNSQSLVPILRQLNPLHPPFNLTKIHCDPSPHIRPVLPNGLFPPGLPPNLVHYFHLSHAPPTSSWQIFGDEYRLAPHCATSPFHRYFRLLRS